MSLSVQEYEKFATPKVYQVANQTDLNSVFSAVDRKAYQLGSMGCNSKDYKSTDG